MQLLVMFTLTIRMKGNRHLCDYDCGMIVRVRETGYFYK